MSTPLIAPLIGTALELTLSLIRAAQAAKEMNRQQFEEIKKRIDKEFNEIPEWDEL